MKLQVGLPFLSSKRAEFGVGIARIEDKYFQKVSLTSEMTNLIKAAMIYLVDQLVLMEVLLIPNNILHVDTEKPL